jgi:hypothetical protein
LLLLVNRCAGFGDAARIVQRWDVRALARAVWAGRMSGHAEPKVSCRKRVLRAAPLLAQHNEKFIPHPLALF